MVDVIFRDVDAATLDRLLGVLDGVAHEFQDNIKTPWSVEAAEQLLRRATMAASRLVRAVIDGGGVVTVEVARRATAPIASHHASGSLSTTWHRLHREARHRAAGEGVRPPRERPIESLRERGKLSGYRMPPAQMEAFRQALRRLGR